MRPPTVIEQGRLIAGRHPCAWGPENAPAEVRDLVRAGVTLFLDLTQDGELEPYASLVEPPAPIPQHADPRLLRSDARGPRRDPGRDRRRARRRRPRLRALLGGLRADGRRRRQLARPSWRRPGRVATTHRRRRAGSDARRRSSSGPSCSTGSAGSSTAESLSRVSEPAARAPIGVQRMPAGSSFRVVLASSERAAGLLPSSKSDAKHEARFAARIDVLTRARRYPRRDGRHHGVRDREEGRRDREPSARSPGARRGAPGTRRTDAARPAASRPARSSTSSSRPLQRWPASARSRAARSSSTSSPRRSRCSASASRPSRRPSRRRQPGSPGARASSQRSASGSNSPGAGHAPRAGTRR